MRDASQESLTLVPNAETENNTKSLVFILFHSERKMKEVMVDRKRTVLTKLEINYGTGRIHRGGR